jgi:hypothetical protein
MDNELFNKLVNETLETDLANNQVIEIRGNYVEEARAYRFEYDGKTLDFPENWQLFTKIQPDHIPFDEIVLYTGDRHSDPLKLAQCLGESIEEICFVVKGEGVFLRVQKAYESSLNQKQLA